LTGKRGLEGPAPASAINATGNGLALVASPAVVQSESLLQGAYRPGRWPREDGDDHSAGAKARGALWKYVSAVIVIEGAVMRV
jgi:hypothetical protein